MAAIDCNMKPFLCKCPKLWRNMENDMPSNGKDGNFPTRPIGFWGRDLNIILLNEIKY